MGFFFFLPPDASSIFVTRWVFQALIFGVFVIEMGCVGVVSFDAQRLCLFTPRLNLNPLYTPHRQLFPYLGDGHSDVRLGYHSERHS